MSIELLQRELAALARSPPGWGYSEERARALLAIGEFLEKSIRPGGPYDLRRKPNPVWDLIEQRLSSALDDIHNSTTAEGIQIWQMYNAGIIARCEEGIMGVDLVPMPRGFGWDERPGLTEQIAGMIDFLLITHGHHDHYDEKLVRACLRLGKSVCMPESLAFSWGSHPSLIPVSDGWTFSLADIGLVGRRGVHVWKETAQEMPLVYYEVSCPRGCTLLFGGDMDCTRALRKTPDKKVDLFFLPWRAPSELYEAGHEKQIGTPLDAARIAVERVKPAGIVFEHCGELKHVYEGFPASYDIALGVQREIGVPSACLFWGEHILWGGR